MCDHKSIFNHDKLYDHDHKFICSHVYIDNKSTFSYGHLVDHDQKSTFGDGHLIILHLVMVTYLTMTKSSGKQQVSLSFCHGFYDCHKKQTIRLRPCKKTMTNTFTCIYYCEA